LAYSAPPVVTAAESHPTLSIVIRQITVRSAHSQRITVACTVATPTLQVMLEGGGWFRILLVTYVCWPVPANAVLPTAAVISYVSQIWCCFLLPYWYKPRIWARGVLM